MASYLMLFRFTDQGIKNIRELPARVEAAKQMFKKAGAEVKEFYALLGNFDTMFLVHAPDDETIAKASLMLGALGNVRAETLRAFSEAEVRKMIAAIG